MNKSRHCGILLHPTSLPGTYGCGTIGLYAYKFIDWLKEAGQSLWQILPLGPTGYGDSPYASFSTFAGNPLLIDLDLLLQKGWTEKSIIRPAEYIKKDGNIDFGALVWWKIPVLKNSALYFLDNAKKEDLQLYKDFCKNNKSWLDDFSLFMSIKSFYDKKAGEEKCPSSIWYEYWPQKLAAHEETALSEWKKDNASDIEIYKVIQFFFDFQWKELKAYANKNGIKIIGDIPIFVAIDSADVWANQKYFQLDKDGKPLCVAGVPPDYFSADGQLWGNPLYDWDCMKQSGYDWWIKRIKRVFELTDILRIDHFRGFEAYWSVPFGAKNAIGGQWKKGPGLDLFKTIKRKLGDIPVIAEDLGVITDEVRLLREQSGFPGMKVLQFAFSPEEIAENGMVNAFMPHMFESSNCVVYTGTHDNDTLQGWLNNCSEKQLKIVADYVTASDLKESEYNNLLKNGKLRKLVIKAAISSCADNCVIPMQDIIGCGNEARMNMPSTTGSNWTWRMKSKDLNEKAAKELLFLTELYGRKN